MSQSIISSDIPGQIGNYVTKTLEYIKPYITWPVIFLFLCVGVAILIAVFFLFKKYDLKVKILEKFTSNNENDTNESTNGSKSAELMLFSVDWCPHCKTARPEWDNLKASLENKQINGYNVVFSDWNCTQETDEISNLINKYKIEGYPTIKLLKDGQIIEFDAKPTESTLKDFLNNVL
jgi:thiol-disulfide isomerase/thioredoxin